MNTFTIKTIVLVTGMAWGLGVMAQMSLADYQASRERLAAEYKAAKAECRPLSHNAQDICIARANGRNYVALTELEAKYKPSARNSAQIHIAKAEAAYAIALERCDDLAGNAKDLCLNEAKAVDMAAKADIKAQIKRDETVKLADEKAQAVPGKARQKSDDADKRAVP